MLIFSFNLEHMHVHVHCMYLFYLLNWFLLLLVRYLHDNCEESRKRRGEVYKLRDREAELSALLKR